MQVFLKPVLFSLAVWPLLNACSTSNSIGSNPHSLQTIQAEQIQKPDVTWQTETNFWLNKYEARFYFSGQDMIGLTLRSQNHSKWSFLQDHQRTECAMTDVQGLKAYLLHHGQLRGVNNLNREIDAFLGNFHLTQRLKNSEHTTRNVSFTRLAAPLAADYILGKSVDDNCH